MSVDRRIREGLRANTELVRPALEHGEEVVMRKVEQRRRERRIRYAGAGALVAAAVATGAVWIPSVGQDEEEAPSPAESPAVTPEVRTAPLLPASGSVVPGTYELRAVGGGPATPRVTVDVPADGFEAWAGSAVIERGGTRSVGLWTAARVKRDPCDPTTPGDDPGPSVGDLAAALEAQRRTRATQPVPVTMGGYEGLFLQLAPPGPGAAKGCPTGRYDLWTIGAGGARSVGPGEVQSLWILDVGGNRVVVNAVGSDDGTDAGRQVTAMVDSVDIVD